MKNVIILVRKAVLTLKQDDFENLLEFLGNLIKITFEKRNNFYEILAEPFFFWDCGHFSSWIHHEWTHYNQNILQV